MNKFFITLFLFAPVNLNLIFNHQEIKAESADFYFDRANKKSEKGLPLEAIADFTSAIYLDPNLWQAFNNRGLEKMLLENYSDAIKDFSKTIEIKPNYANAHFYRGWSKDLLGDYQGAINDLNKAIYLDKNKADYHFVLGNAYFKSGYKDAACISWNEAGRLSNKIDQEINENAKTLFEELCN